METNNDKPTKAMASFLNYNSARWFTGTVTAEEMRYEDARNLIGSIEELRELEIRVMRKKAAIREYAMGLKANNLPKE